MTSTYRENVQEGSRESPVKLSQREALELFSGLNTPADQRRNALSTLISLKYLPKQAESAEITKGRSHLLSLAIDSEASPQKLLAIAESVRLAQVVKRWSADILKSLQPAFSSELPPMRLLAEADDRLNVARACSQMNTPWLVGYLLRSIAEEETGEKPRAELIATLLEKSTNLAEVLVGLARAFELVRPDTEAPGATTAKRLTRTLAGLREAIVESEIEAGDNLGAALYDLLVAPLSAVGKPQEEKVQIDLSREALMTIHDIVRTRMSVVTEPEIYSAVEYCRRLCGGFWPVDLKKPLERLITDVSEALVLLGRQGQRDQNLLRQLEVLCGRSERARRISQEIAARHPELPEDVRYWLEMGRVRATHPVSDSAIEAAAKSADESIGLALHVARETRRSRDSLRAPLISSLEIYDPTLLSATQELLTQIQTLAVHIEQAATLRNLDLYGTPGEEVEMLTKYFTVVGNAPRQRMTVKHPAVVRKRSDGTLGDVVIKGLVE